MKKFIPAITLITILAAQAPVHATWSSRQKPKTNKTTNTESGPKTPGFNVKDNRDWFVEADYLFWKPHLENNYFALKAASPDYPTSPGQGSPITATGKLKQPKFELSSGVRLGFGFYNSDSWDVGLRGTYFYSEAKKTVHADPSVNTLTVPDWFGSLFGFDGTKAFNRWQMNFGLLDLSFGREFFLTRRFAVHPFIGLRGAIINQKNLVKYTAIFKGTVPAAFTVNGSTKLSAKNNMWGVGPRAGLDLNFYVSRDWSFLGGLAASLLYMQSHVKETFYGQDITTNQAISPSVLFPITIAIKDSNNFGRANVDAYFGLGWSHWYNHDKNRVSIALTFEAQQWFGINQWFSLDLTNKSSNNSSPLNIRSDKNTGDLSLVGGTVHFQLDF